MSEKPVDPAEYVEWMYANYPHPYDLAINDEGEKVLTFKDDHVSLIEIIKENSIRSVYEIGTSAGYTSLIMAMYPGVEKVKTIDPWKLKTTGMCVGLSPNIEFVVASSFNVSIGADIGKYDMVFIDADHEYPAVISDTRMAFALEPRVIAWHDYGEQWPGVPQAINDFSKRLGRNSNCEFGRQIEFDVILKPKLIAYSVIRRKGE